MIRHANAGACDSGAAQVISWRNEPASNTKCSIEFQAPVIDTSNRQYPKPVLSYRLRLIGIRGFRRRRRWRDPFTAAIFRVERRELGVAP
jgi:hypothetical protein